MHGPGSGEWRGPAQNFLWDRARQTDLVSIWEEVDLEYERTVGALFGEPVAWQNYDTRELPRERIELVPSP